MVSFWKIVTMIGSPEVLVVVMLALVAFLWRRRHALSWLILVIAAGNVLTPILKMMVQRPRPLDNLVDESGFSFPSGHALGVTLFAFALIILAHEYGWRRGKLALVSVLASLFLIAVSYSRLALHVHWISDVIIGVLIGAVWVVIMFTTFRHFQPHAAKTSTPQP